MADQTPENGTGDPRLDAIFARMQANALEKQARKAAEAEMEPQSGPESASSDSPKGYAGRVEPAESHRRVQAETTPRSHPSRRSLCA